MKTANKMEKSTVSDERRVEGGEKKLQGMRF